MSQLKKYNILEPVKKGNCLVGQALYSARVSFDKNM